MSLFSLTRTKKKATECSTLPVLHNIDSSIIVLSQHQQYIRRHGSDVYVGMMVDACIP